MAKVSVVLPVYHGTDPAQLLSCLQSLLLQTRRPDEILIVFDGLNSYISALLEVLDVELGSIHFVSVFLPINSGPGMARHFGIFMASGSIIFMMDSDDVCDFSRIELQLSTMQSEYSSISCASISESVNPDISSLFPYHSRKASLDINSARNLAQVRTPMNNVTLAFNRNLYLLSGGYPPLRTAEDWVLMSRFLRHTSSISFLQQDLVNVRSGMGQVKRRQGIRVLIDELKSSMCMFAEGNFNFPSLVLIFISRPFIRLLPLFLLKNVRNILRCYSSR